MGVGHCWSLSVMVVVIIVGEMALYCTVYVSYSHVIDILVLSIIDFSSPISALLHLQSIVTSLSR